MVLAGQTVEGQGLLDGFLDPVDELVISVAPFGDPCGEIAAGLLDVSPVVEPAQFLQAVVVGLARQMVEGVAQEVHVAALDGRFGEDLADGRAKARVIVGDDELDAAEAARRVRAGSPARTSCSRGWPCRRPGSGGDRPSRCRRRPARPGSRPRRPRAPSHSGRRR